MDTENISQSIKPLFEIDLSQCLGDEFSCMMNDILRLFSIQIVLQLLMTSCNITFQDFIILLLYIGIGVMLYWIAIRKIIIFV